MFWAFFKDCQYDEHLWPIVWVTENLIQSTIAAEHDHLRGLGMAELDTLLRNYLDRLGFPGKWSLRDIPPAWVDSFLDDHLPSVHEFVRTLSREFVPSSESLGYQQEKLFSCIRESEGLRNYFKELITPP